ncbi:hypothetical protein CRG98_009366 [Punica granatum]|uniref:Uncharacterized protein n=1 Tax=Punica granatum TaxID=22663 RepID=A0A2I0KP24_PUNGR|nr:hypothetical protein CRG98_009366 [Punica granatum]
MPKSAYVSILGAIEVKGVGVIVIVVTRMASTGLRSASFAGKIGTLDGGMNMLLLLPPRKLLWIEFHIAPIKAYRLLRLQNGMGTIGEITISLPSKSKSIKCSKIDRKGGRVHHFGRQVLGKDKAVDYRRNLSTAVWRWWVLSLGLVATGRHDKGEHGGYLFRQSGWTGIGESRGVVTPSNKEGRRHSWNERGCLLKKG